MKLNQLTRRQRTAILVGALAILAVCVLAVGSILILSANKPKTHSEYLEAAKKYAEADDFDEAVSTYWAAIQSNQYDTRSYAALGQLYLENGEIDEALQVLDLGVGRTGSQELSEQREAAEAQQEAEETQLAETQSENGDTQSDSVESTSANSDSSSGSIRNTSGTAANSGNSGDTKSDTKNDTTDKEEDTAEDKKAGASDEGGTEQDLQDSDSKKPGSTGPDDADDSASGGSDSSDSSSAKSSDAESEVSLNTGLLNDFCGYTYEDFEEAYGEAEIGSTSSDGLEVTFEGFEGTTYFDTDDDEPGKKDMPTRIELNQMNLLFQGMGNSLTLEQLQEADDALEDAEIGTENGRTVVKFITCGCAVFIESDDEGTIERDAWNSITSLDRAENTTDEEPDEDEESGSSEDKKNNSKNDSNKKDTEDENDKDDSENEEALCTLEGTLTNKRSDDEIEDAELTLYKGSGSGKKLGECETDEDGDYSFEELAEGKYTLKIEAEGYQDKTVTVELEDEETTKDIELSPHEIRIELSWKEGAQNLDAHLDGETEDGEEIEISPEDKEAKEDGEILAELDKDVKDGKGTETITLYALDGEYTFTVKDKDKTGKLGKSEAEVKLYYDDRLEEEYTVPETARNEWEVFTLKDGEPEEDGEDAD